VTLRLEISVLRLYRM